MSALMPPDAQLAVVLDEDAPRARKGAVGVRAPTRARGMAAAAGRPRDGGIALGWASARCTRESVHVDGGGCDVHWEG